MGDGNTTSANWLSRSYDWLTGAAVPGAAGTGVQNTPPESKYEPGVVIVKFKVPPDLDQIYSRHQVSHHHRVFPDNLGQLHHNPRRKMGELPDLTNIYKLKVPEGKDVGAVIEEFKKDPNVLYAVPNYARQGQVSPNDPLLSTQWALTKTNVLGAWDIEKGKASVVVAVIDGGRKDHPDASPINSNSWNFMNASNDPVDGYGHGTGVFGVMAAKADNGVGIAGINWNPNIMVLKACDDANNCNDAETAAAIKWAADKGADVLNLSWGSYDCSPLLEEAVTYACNAGAILVAAAGNDGVRTPTYPAALPCVISVGSTDAYDARIENRGTWVQFYAPGVGVKTLGLNNDYVLKSGTSFATPHVTGLVSLLLAQDPTRTFPQIVDIIRRSSVDRGLPGLDPDFGFGRIDMKQALSQVSYVDPHVNAFITSLAPYQPIGRGPIAISGTAAGSTFTGYSFSIAPGDNPTAFSANGFTLVGGGATQVSNGKLATLDTTTLSSAGVYTIKLSASGSAATNNATNDFYLSFVYDPSIDNQPPAITVTPVTSAELGKPLTITAGVSDDGGVREVYLHYRTTGASDWKSLPMTGPGNYSATISGPEIQRAGLEYYIEAGDTSSNYANTPVYAVSNITDNLPPAVPGNLSTLSDVGQIKLSYVPPSTNADGSPFADSADLAGYKISYHDLTAAGAWTTIDVLNTTQKVFNGLVNGDTYEFKVQAYDAAGNYGPWSSIISAKPLNSPPPLPDSGVLPDTGTDLPPIITPDAFVGPEANPDLLVINNPDTFAGPEANPDLLVINNPDTFVGPEANPDLLVINNPDTFAGPEANPDLLVINNPDTLTRPEVQPFGPEAGTDNRIVTVPDGGVDTGPEAPVVLVDAFFTPDTGLLAEAGLLAPDAGVLPEAGQVFPDAGRLLPEAGQLSPDARNNYEVKPADADNPPPVQKNAAGGCGCSLGGHSRYVENSSRPTILSYLLRILR